jgi:hypothetical protein
MHDHEGMAVAMVSRANGEDTPRCTNRVLAEHVSLVTLFKELEEDARDTSYWVNRACKAAFGAAGAATQRPTQVSDELLSYCCRYRCRAAHLVFPRPNASYSEEIEGGHHRTR